MITKGTSNTFMYATSKPNLFYLYFLKINCSETMKYKGRTESHEQQFFVK
jgi:hypothetical protein